MTNLGTETIEDILGDTFTPEQKAIFPIKQKLAFYHPMRPDILIFLGGEMPHLVKKTVNALENSGIKPTQDLILRSKRLFLLMLQKVWEYSQGSFGEMRTNRNTLEHDQKNLTIVCKYCGCLGNISNSIVFD